jgi:hypothetical protein
LYFSFLSCSFPWFYDRIASWSGCLCCCLYTYSENVYVPFEERWTETVKSSNETIVLLYEGSVGGKSTKIKKTSTWTVDTWTRLGRKDFLILSLGGELWSTRRSLLPRKRDTDFKERSVKRVGPNKSLEDESLLLSLKFFSIRGRITRCDNRPWYLPMRRSQSGWWRCSCLWISVSCVVHTNAKLHSSQSQSASSVSLCFCV